MELSKRGKDWTGVRRGHVVVVKCVGKNQHHTYEWECLCDCGNTCTKTSAVLQRGVEFCSNRCALRKTNVTHGASSTRAYRAWVSAKSRCYLTTHKNYAEYGGRGIRMHEEWVNDFPAFHAHIGDPPTEKHTLDRIDFDGNYEPGNVRWATQHEQNRNRRNTLWVEIDGEKIPLIDAAERAGVNYAAARERYLSGKRGREVLTPAYKDWSGVMQGMLTVIREDGRDAHGSKLWLCKCECGKETHKSSNALVNGIKSCSTACGVSASNRARAK